MPGQKRIKTEYRNIYYNTNTGRYDVKYNYKIYNALKQKNDYKSKWKYGISSIEEAKKELAFLKNKRDESNGTGITIKGAFDLWKNKACAQGYSKMTVVNTENYVKMLGEVISTDTKIEDISAELYDEIFAKCRGKYKDETIKTLNATFRKLINLSYKKRLLNENPLGRMDNVKAQKTDKIRIITSEEWKRIDEHFSNNSFANTNCRFMFNVLYYTGIRIGECLALTWADFEFFDPNAKKESSDGAISSMEYSSDVNEENILRMRLNINKTILRDGTPMNTTKNKKNRKIPLSPIVIKLYQKEAETWQRDKADRIFCGTYNTYVSYLTAACKKIEIPHCSCHSFRHTFISNLMRKGVPLPVIEKVSGDTQKTIFERYSHMFDDDDGLVLDALENL